MKEIVCIMGPTGAGKSAAAILLAERIRGCIINFDSRQVYKRLSITTARPTVEEMALCPHRLYGFLELNERIDAGSFVEMAARTIDETAREGLVPILVGGTGLYLRALIGGLAPIPDISPSIRHEVVQYLEEHGHEATYARLEQIDPAYAARISPADKQRLTRALEVYLSTGEPFSSWHEKGRTGYERYRAVKIGIGLELAVLTPLLSRRIENMLEYGAIEEVREAYAEFPDATLPAFTGIGCMEIILYLQGRIGFEEMKSEWLRRTRAYAKRQITWFRKEEGVHWFSPFENDRLIKYAESGWKK